MKKRNLFGMFFGRKENNVTTHDLQVINGYNSQFTPSDFNLYNNQLVRACIDAIARNGAKLNPKHIRRKEKKIEHVNSNLQMILSEKPNSFMNAYDFYYKMITQLYLYNNAFAWIEKDDSGNVINIFPLNYQNCKLKETQNGIMFVEFSFDSGMKYKAPYGDIIHLKRFFNDHDIFGGDNTAIYNAVSLHHTIFEGLINAIKTTSSIKGILKTIKSHLKPEDVKNMRDTFVRDFMNNNDSIAGLDASFEFTPVSLNPVVATAEQIESNKKEILSYYGLNETILQSNYSSDDWNAFYESVIEPIALMLGLEYTNKIFTKKQREFGNQIIFESNRLQYSTIKEKNEVVKTMQNYMTINEIREIFNLAPIEDGERILQSLNFIDQTIANDYQGGKQ